MGRIRNTTVPAAFKENMLMAFVLFEKGGQRGFALDLPDCKSEQIPLHPPFSKGEETP